MSLGHTTQLRLNYDNGEEITEKRSLVHDKDCTYYLTVPIKLTDTTK